jgi:hypothetical protein
VAKYKNANIEEAEFIQVTCKQDDILEHVSVSKKTLIAYINRLMSWGLLAADSYHQRYIVYHKKIREAMTTPPPAEKAKPRGRHVAESADQVKTTNCTSEPVKTTDCNFVSLTEFVNLQNKVVELQSEIVNLQNKMAKLQTQIVDLQSAKSNNGASEAVSYSNAAPPDNIRYLEITKIEEDTSNGGLQPAAFVALCASRSNDTHEAPSVLEDKEEQEEDEQPPLLEVDSPPVMPPLTAKWVAETLVQVTEAIRGRALLR